MNKCFTNNFQLCTVLTSIIKIITVTFTSREIIVFLTQPISERLKLEIITKLRLVNVHKGSNDILQTSTYQNSSVSMKHKSSRKTNTRYSYYISTLLHCNITT